MREKPFTFEAFTRSMPNKFRILLLILLFIILVVGFFVPNGIRTAVSNNIWSISFLKTDGKSKNPDNQLTDIPSRHRHAGVLLANQALREDQTSLDAAFMESLVMIPDRLNLRTRANLLFLQQDYENAIFIWKDLGMWSTLQYTASALLKEGKFDEAILASRSGYELYPNRSVSNYKNTMMAKANFLLEQGQISEAISEYKTIIVRFPGEGSPYEALARAYWQNQQPDLALFTLEQGWEPNTDNVRFFITAASIYEQNGMTADALRAYQSALLIDPDNSTAFNGIERLTGADE